MSSPIMYESSCRDCYRLHCDPVVGCIGIPVNHCSVGAFRNVGKEVPAHICSQRSHPAQSVVVVNCSGDGAQFGQVNPYGGLIVVRGFVSVKAHECEVGRMRVRNEIHVVKDYR